MTSLDCSRVKSGNFGQLVNSDRQLQTVKIEMRRIFTVCLVNLFFIPINEIRKKQCCCPNIADCPNLADFTLQHRDIHVYLSIQVCNRVKSGNFGHQVNLDIHLQTVEIKI